MFSAWLLLTQRRGSREEPALWRCTGVAKRVPAFQMLPFLVIKCQKIIIPAWCSGHVAFWKGAVGDEGKSTATPPPCPDLWVTLLEIVTGVAEDRNMTNSRVPEWTKSLLPNERPLSSRGMVTAVTVMGCDAQSGGFWPKRAERSRCGILVSCLHFPRDLAELDWVIFIARCTACCLPAGLLFRATNRALTGRVLLLSFSTGWVPTCLSTSFRCLPASSGAFWLGQLRQH